MINITSILWAKAQSNTVNRNSGTIWFEGYSLINL